MVMALAPTVGPSMLTCHTWYVHPFCMGVKVLACKGPVCPHPDMTVKMTWSNDRRFEFRVHYARVGSQHNYSATSGFSSKQASEIKRVRHQH